MAYQRPDKVGILQSMTGNKFGGGYPALLCPAEATDPSENWRWRNQAY